MSEGKKYDGAKAPIGRGFLAYFPQAIQLVAEVSKFGATKYDVPYEEKNWRFVDQGELRYRDAAARHLLAELGGDSVDDESGLLHMAHAAWDLLAAIELTIDKAKQCVVEEDHY